MRVTIVLLALLSACASDPTLLTSATKHKDFLATDSRLRVNTTSDQGIFSTAGLVEAQRITCTEPSPDVATTLANSFGGGLSIFGKGSASLTAQQVQGLVQLGERTAAIQLLRDKMYQTCLAYSNGAISGTTYSLIMSRLDDAIITLSLGDGAAGAFGRSLAALGGEATGDVNAAVTGLPGEVAKIEDQASKLAASNQKVDDAATALDDHNATKPADGKEDEYNQQTADLGKKLAAAKAERNALLELLRASANSAAKATAKISDVKAGGGLTASPNAAVLRDMHSDFLVADSSRDLIFACMVELGLRGDGKSDQDLRKMTAHLEKLFTAKPDGVTAAAYAGAILRQRSTALAAFCAKELPTLITDATTKAQQLRLAKVRSDSAKALVREKELFGESIKLCNTEFKGDADRKRACLDQIIPIPVKSAQAAPTPAPKAPAKK